MTNLEPQADKAVRDAVDAFMEGRLNPEFAGETVFETKNSRYRLLDGVVFAAPVDTLIGAELVGWLMETTRRSVVGSAWQPGARAVLVDRHRGRNIIVTSTTRLLHLEAPPSGSEPVAPPRGGWSPPSGQPVPAPALPFPLGETPKPPARPEPPPQRPRIIPSTPPPPQIVAPAPPPPAALRPSPVQSAALLQKRAAAVHLPPRPIAPSNPTPLPVPSRPLPMPAPPPRREGAPGHAGHAVGHPQTSEPPAYEPEAPGWDLTSSEFELDGEPTHDDADDDNPTRHDAGHYADPDSLEGSTGRAPRRARIGRGRADLAHAADWPRCPWRPPLARPESRD